MTMELISRVSAPSVLRSALVCIGIIAAYIAFTLATMPKPVYNLPILAINKAQVDTIDELIVKSPLRLFRPIVFEPDRILWQPTSVLPIYVGEKTLGPVGNYLFFSCLFLVTCFLCAQSTLGSTTGSALLTFMFAFGTQLNYAYTYGSLIALYVVLIYGAINFTAAVFLITGRGSALAAKSTFIASLILLALSTEWWLNFAVAALVGAAVGAVWSHRHGATEAGKGFKWIMIVVAAVLTVYLIIRLRYPGQFTTRGAEEELLLTYKYAVLGIEDFIVNFLTLLYMTLDNYLPSLISSSNSLTRLGREVILSEQYGYHPSHQHLVPMSHVFLWRFYAGAAVLAYLTAYAWVGTKAWTSRQVEYGVVLALMTMVMSGFSTHLLIKMRPYNSVPGLAYKAVISIAFFTVLAVYVAELLSARLATRPRRALLAAICGCVILAALTRPGMQARLLSEVGLIGHRDPWRQITDWR